ncbi:aldose epimerase family protein [Roseateles sp.]|uniref:aldose epimerase family protein n=1 Tax=Roseateles sp. TaxID=1971397 RepID=UPI00394C006C
MNIREYGRLPDGRLVHEYVLENELGLRLVVITLGGIVTQLEVPDARGVLGNVCLGFEALDDYVHRNPSFGIIVGRYGNRIAGGSFELDGQRYELDRNEGSNCLHGGRQGFGKQLWQADVETPMAGEAAALRMRYVSLDGEQGFPGNMHVSVRYSLAKASRAWRIDYEATTDKPTVVNLTHHAYFNLAGGGSVLDHRLQLHASRFTEVDAKLIPTGHVPVEGTPFDFRSPRVVGERIRQGHPQLQVARGYDHNFVLDAPLAADGLRPAARLEDLASGRAMTVFTSEPGVQFYSGNFLDGSLKGWGGQMVRQGDGLCLETQHYPDSPNHPASEDWPSTVLRPGTVWRSSTVYQFD